MTTPYDPPIHQTDARKRPWIRGIDTLSFSYPVVLVASFYGLWLVAWISLGRAPRANLDDPKEISVVVSILYFVPSILVSLFPLGVIGGLALQLMASDRNWARRGAGAVLVLCIWIAAFAVLWWDPIEVVNWYAD